MLVIQLARFTIAFVWIYHGLVPKLLHVAPLELLMTASFGLSEEHSYLLTKAAGMVEVAFGLLFAVFYQQKWINYASIAGLSGLLLYAVLFVPVALAEAFNPVTTNTPVIVLGLILLQQLTNRNNSDLAGAG